MNTKFDWTPAQIDILRSEWDKGTTTAAIGRILGVSKNAIVGKAHRLSLAIRPSPIRRRVAKPNANLGETAGIARSKSALRLFFPKAQSRAQAANRAAGAARTTDDYADIEVDGRNRCVYPTWQKDSDPKLSCGKAVQAGKIYCPAHQALCIVRTRGRTPALPAEGSD